MRIVEGADIFLISYLLTETRNQWDKFFVRLVGLAKDGAIFYFSEPVSWQLHWLIRMFSGRTEPPSFGLAGGMVMPSPLSGLRFVWIDSSMYCPEMQGLDRRSGGPAVLLALKVQHIDGGRGILKQEGHY